jgi:predicted DNA-binding transcriptional regulator AlpA
MRAEDLVSQAEIAERLSITRQRFQQLAARPDFPAPVASPGGRRIWLWAHVHEWDVARKEALAERRRNVGRKDDSRP